MRDDRSGFWYFVLGILFILGALYFIASGVVFVNTELDDYSMSERLKIGATMAVFCATPTLIIGMIFLFIPFYVRKRNEKLNSIAMILKGYKKYSLSTLSKKTDTDPKQIEKMVLMCIDKGFVHGYIDPENKEFIQTPEGLSKFQINDIPKKKIPVADNKEKNENIATGDTGTSKYCVRCNQPLLHDPTNDIDFCPRCE